jgi:two-component system NtrC family sensor kinase
MTPHRLRSLVYVGLPVAVGAVLVSLAAVNIVLVKTWRGELEDSVLWVQSAANVIAKAVDPSGAGAAAGLRTGDVLLQVEGKEVTKPADVTLALHTASAGHPLTYVVQRQGADQPISVPLQPMVLVRTGLYYALALVGILSIVVGGSVRLRRPNDPATLHFFWLTVAFFGVLAFTPSGRYDRPDYFFEWSDLVARLVLPPLFLHFALVFPERPNPWVRTPTGRAVLPFVYAPAAALGLARAGILVGRLTLGDPSRALQTIETVSLVYLAACLLAGLAIMTQALGRLRSVTARRQLRWIVWGSSVGALPFVLLYVVPYLVGAPVPGMEYTAVLLGCIPLAFASALVRYRLMDIEVIVKRGFVVAAVALLLGVIYSVTLFLLSLLPGVDERGNSFWALLATLVVALVAPSLWKAIQAALDRLYYRDRYDYRRALVSFTRDLNSDLDLQRLTRRLVDRIAETLGVDRIALFLPDPAGEPGRLVAVTAGGFSGPVPAIEPGSILGARIADGQTVVVDDPLPVRRLGGSEGAAWREAGLFNFVPCVSNELTIGLIAVGRRPLGEPLSSEDMTLLGAVAGQAATAIENARLYSQLQGKAEEVQRLHQFSDRVVESLSDGLVVVDMDDRVLRWNRRAEALVGVDRTRATGRRLAALFNRGFVDALTSARKDAPGGASLFRLTLVQSQGERRERLVNVAVAPFTTADGGQAGWIIVIEDVTERANLEEQLRLSEKMAAIGLLAAGVAHEVNTPLTGISSFTQMLLERTDQGDPRKELLEKIERQTFRAAKIVNSLLSLARPSDGEAQALDLNATIGDVLSLLEHQFKMSRIQVRRELASGAIVVQGVEYKLQQVFLNLFLNARDAMPKGGWLSVATRANDGHAVVEVSDTGVGIPVEHLARIYDPFFTTKPEGRGTGLGLSVTYGIVQEHGGTLVCESAPDQGTRFRLTLPISGKSAAEVAN